MAVKRSIWQSWNGRWFSASWQRSRGQDQWTILHPVNRRSCKALGLRDNTLSWLCLSPCPSLTPTQSLLQQHTHKCHASYFLERWRCGGRRVIACTTSRPFVHTSASHSRIAWHTTLTCCLLFSLLIHATSPPSITPQHSSRSLSNSWCLQEWDNKPLTVFTLTQWHSKRKISKFPVSVLLHMATVSFVLPDAASLLLA